MSIFRLLLENYPNSLPLATIAQRLGHTELQVREEIRALTNQGVKIEGEDSFRLTIWPDLLLPEIIRFYYEGPLGKNIFWSEQTSSTNLKAKELARAGAPHGTLIVAEEQTAGRGRRGRSWLSPKGSGIFATLLLRPQLAAARGPLFTLATGVAVVRALHQLGLEAAWLKWPNDVWVGEKKLAGILAEMSGDVSALHYIIIGMGINVDQVAWPPDINSATSLRLEMGTAPPRAQLLAQILRELEQALLLPQGKDLQPLFMAWKPYDRLLGHRVRVIDATSEYHATALDLDPGGGLLVRLDDGSERLVLAADVSLRPAP